ncbi:hypothetical protein ACH3XW_33325 [Acanthocheilonema viteae]
MTRRTSNRIRKTKQTYSPPADDNTSFNIPSTSKKIRQESRNISLDNSKSLSELSAKKVTNDEEHDSITLNHNTFWNFATTLGHPIMREKVANDKVITLLLKEVSRAIRHLILEAKFVMQKAERQKLLCDDLNTCIEMENGKLLFGFMEDNKWQKIGDVFVPSDEVLDLSSCSSSVQLKTLGSR